MKFQITLKKDDWKWVVTQMGKFADKTKTAHYRLDCFAIRVHSPIEAEFSATNGCVLATATVYMDRNSYDPDGDGSDRVIFIPKVFKDALAANPKKGKEEITLRIETGVTESGGGPLNMKSQERDDHAYLDGVEIRTEKGRFPKTEEIVENVAKEAETLFAIDAKALKKGVKDYVDKSKAAGIKPATFKSNGCICITASRDSRACFMYVRQRDYGDKRTYRNEYGVHNIGRLFEFAMESESEKKRYLRPDLLLKASEFMSDTDEYDIAVKCSQYGIHHLYSECQKRARFVHISTTIMPLACSDAENTDGDVAPVPTASAPEPTPAPTPEPKPEEPVAEIDDDMKDKLDDFLVDYILRYALNKRIGSNHFSARTLGLVHILDEVEKEYFDRADSVKTRFGEDNFNLAKHTLDEILDDQTEALLPTFLQNLNQAA